MDALKVVYQGAHAAVQLHRTLLFVVTSRTTAIRIMECFTLNGVIFLGSIFALDYAVFPLLHWIGDGLRILASSELANSLGIGSTTAATTGEVGKADGKDWEEVYDSVQGHTATMFTITWLVPMYALSFILNAIWYVEISEQVFKQEYGKIAPPSKVTNIIVDELYRIMLMVFLTIQVYGVYYFIPYIGTVYGLAYTSWTYSFYCYDYKWTLLGWSLEARLRVFEEHWLYMLGFGMPCALVTWWLPQFVGYGVYAMIFPLCMMLAIISAPIRPRTSQATDSTGPNS